MKTLSKADLAKRKSAGATVKRKMGAAKPPEKKVVEPTKEVEAPVKAAKVPVSPMPSELAKSLNALVDQQAATSKVVSQNSEVIKSLFAEMAQMAHKMDRKPTAFDFKITRNRAGFMENIRAVPVMDEPDTH